MNSKLNHFSLTKLLLSLKLPAMTLLVSASAVAQPIDFKRDEQVFTVNLAKTMTAEAANKLYNKVYRNYFEICAGSQWKKRGQTPGGNFGHGFAILHGACRFQDPATGIPQLKVCPGQTVGISTDSDFNNVQWSAVQSREMMLYGGLSPSKPLDAATYQTMLATAASDGFLENVKFRTDSTQVKNELWSALDYTAGTEFAVAVPRDVSCTRIPLVGSIQGQEDGPLLSVIEYFNTLNRRVYLDSIKPGAQGKPPDGYDYDAQVNNCAHTPYNALSPIGFWKAKNTSGHPDRLDDQIDRYRKGDLATPFNAVLEAFDDGDLRGIISWIKANPLAKEMLLKHGWVRQQAGTIIENIPPHNFQNSIFDPTVHREFFSLMNRALWFLRRFPGMSFFPEPDATRDAARFDSLIKDANAESMSLGKNLEAWKKRYAEFLLDERMQRPTDDVEVALRAYFEKKHSEAVAILAELPRLQNQVASEPAIQFSL